MAVERAGFLYNNAGTAIQGATVDAFDRNTTTPNRGTTTTNTSGYWTLSITTEGRYDVRITSGSSIRWLKYDRSEQMQELETNVLKIRDSDDSHTYEFVPSNITANRTITIPLLTGNDTLALIGFAQTWSTIQTYTAEIQLNTGGLIQSASGVNLILNAQGTGTIILQVAGTAYLTIDDAVPELLTSIASGAGNAVGYTIQNSTATGSARFYLGNNAGQARAGLQYHGASHSSRPSQLWIKTEAAESIIIGTSDTERARLNDSGNLKLAGTATRATTEGTNHLDIYDGTAPVGTLSAGISLYSTSGELRVMDSGGTATLLSPHDDEGNWIFDAHNTVTGRRLRIDMEKLMKALNAHFGWDFVKEYVE